MRRNIRILEFWTSYFDLSALPTVSKANKYPKDRVKLHTVFVTMPYFNISAVHDGPRLSCMENALTGFLSSLAIFLTSVVLENLVLGFVCTDS